MNVVVSIKTLANEFSEFTGAIIRQARILEKTNMKLERARDLLLTRVMNGEITV
jgi:hypothetical protein